MSEYLSHAVQQTKIVRYNSLHIIPPFFISLCQRPNDLLPSYFIPQELSVVVSFSTYPSKVYGV